MGDANALAHQPLDHHARRGCAAYRDQPQLAKASLSPRRRLCIQMRKHGEPDRGHACRMGNAFLQHQFMQDRRFIGGREHKLHARHRPGKGQTPACGMEHRDDGEQRGCRRQIKYRRRNFCHGVQHGRAVLVEHALGMAGGATGIAEHARIALITHYPIEVAVLPANQRFILRTVKNNKMFDRFEMRLQPVDDRLESCIIHQHTVFGMVHDVDQVFIKQPDIDGMNHAASANRAIPGSQMAVVVHGKCRDAVAGF